MKHTLIGAVVAVPFIALFFWLLLDATALLVMLLPVILVLALCGVFGR